MKKLLNPDAIFLVGIIMISAVSRWIPHAPNWTPLLGLALFAGYKIKTPWLAALVPVAAMVISDIALDLHATVWSVYLALVLTTLLPRFVNMKSNDFKKVAVNGLILSAASSIGFFAITNFGVWLSSGYYAKNLAGLWTSFAMGIPFLTGTFASCALSFAMFFVADKMYLRAISAKLVKA